MWRCTIFLLVAFSSTLFAQRTSAVIDTVVSQSAGVVTQAQAGQGSTRQCSCDEEHACVEEMKKQALDCTQPCFAEFNQVAPRPDSLRQCLQGKTNVLGNFVDCFERRVGSCVPGRNGPKIPKTDIRQIFVLGEQRITQQSAAVQHIVNAAADFAKCVKNCFLQKNQAGFCFDRYQCQPLIEVQKAASSLKACTKSINWKKEASDLCTCGVNAGLNELQSYCSLFQAMSRKGNRRN